MQLVELHKALANDTRMDIMSWLSDPEKHFRPHKDESASQMVSVRR